ncbi:uncharacterized protein LOC100182141 [Ciona intestinalis]
MMKHSPAQKNYTKQGDTFNTLSPLMVMQRNVQMKLLAEKERKLSQLYQAQQQNSLQNVAGKSSRQVQEYFKTNTNRYTNSNIGGRMRDATWSGNSDRRVVLPPLKQRKSNHTENQDRKFRNKENSNGNLAMPQSNSTHTMFNSKTAVPRQSSFDSPGYHGSSRNISKNTLVKMDSPPDMTNLKLARNKKILEKKKQTLKALNNFTPVHVEGESNAMAMSEKPTDFQKWQMEHDLQRKNRLENYRAKNGNDSMNGSKKIDDQPLFYNETVKVVRDRTTTNAVHSKHDKSNDENGKTKRSKRNPFKKAQRFSELNYANDKSSEFKTPEENAPSYKKASSVPSTRSYIEKSNQPNAAMSGFTKPVLVRHNSNTSTPDRYFQNSRTNSRTSTHYSASPSEQNIRMAQQGLRSNVNEIKQHRNVEQQVPLEYAQHEVVLVPCNICGRKFNLDRLPKHKEACAKTSNKKRKVFDMATARKKGTELENFKEVKQVRTKEIKQKNNWKLKHQDFIQTVRHAKTLSKYEAMGGNIADLPPPPPSVNPDYIQCKYCERRFAPQAAERHIPKCKDMKSRPAPLKRKTGARR